MDKYIGKRLDGRYEIREIIGVGGMAYVYKAYDTIDDRIVAIKILKDEYLANEDFTRRFKNESKAIAILSHPNIVKVYDVSFGDRIQYIVMEYIDGITLKEYIDQQKDIKWKEAVHFSVQILRALQHAHDKGIVHRDIKPQNIMLLPDGTIKVTDFGIARFSRSDLRATSGNNDKVVGSVHYISPEQARGEITDEKADIYSVGVMLYEMLTGRLPFEGDSAVSIAIMQMQAEPVKPREVKPDIPDGLEEITLKAMQKDPAKRYQSAAEMLYDIDEFKRNPSIHFAYKYFVDETPTRFVETISRVKGSEPASGADNKDPDKDEENEEKRKPPVIWILAAIAGAFVLVALLFVGAVFLLGLNGDSKENVTVPNFVGRSYTDVVKDTDANAKFTLNYVQENSDTVPKNQIISQDKKAGMSVKQKATITLTVSLGPQMIDIPTYNNTDTSDVVKSRLESADFVVQVVESNNESVAKGFVIKLVPAAGEKAAKGSTVVMYVSTGTEPVAPVAVPNVVGASLTEAKAALAAKGFTVNNTEISYENNSNPKDVVISQTPDSSKEAVPGTAVKLVVSTGYQNVSYTIPMPNTLTPIDLQVYVNGQLDNEYTLSKIIPSDYGSKTIILKNAQSSYPVTIMIRASSDNNSNEFKVYRKFTANGLTGKPENVESYPFDDPGTTSTSGNTY